MKGVIIAAGMGSRMREFTSEMPKCLLPVGNTTLIENTISLMRDNGIEDIAVITGYLADKIQLDDVTYYPNLDYTENNILHSLMCAQPFMDDELMVAYSDIWLEDGPVKKLASSREDVVISVDTNWIESYEGRTEHPVSEAENVFYDANGMVTQIGKHILPDERNVSLQCGEFIGLCKVSGDFLGKFKSIYLELDAKLSRGEPFQKSRDWYKSYLTDFLQELVDRGYPVSCSFHENQWREIDTPQDYSRLLVLKGAEI